jgi:N,N'-diacetyllegionaminate synthase
VVSEIVIDGVPVGQGRRCYVIAEVGVNHDGDVEQALRLVDAAAETGADAVKFQTFVADRLVTADAPKAGYQLQTTDPVESQLGMLRSLELDLDAHRRIVDRCRERGITFLSTPFDVESVALLVHLGVSAIKVASPEVTNHPLLEVIGSYGLPVILSTGMSTLGEVEEAVAVLVAAGCRELALLHCVSSYPAPLEETNLRAITTLAMRFGVPVGYSDHTVGDAATLAAVALGAQLVEKHLTTDRTLPGPDHAASAEPDELALLIRGIRSIETMLGDGIKRPMPCEQGNRTVVRRSLAAARDLDAGSILAADALTALRPATAISPSARADVIGRTG